MADEIEDSEERVVDQVIDELESAEDDETAYVADFTTVDCSEYGIPQRRNRIIVFGVREDIAQDGHTPESFFEMLSSHTDTDRDEQRPYHLQHALSGLPKIRREEGGDIVLGKPAGSLSDYVSDDTAPYGLGTETNLSFNHRAREHPMPKDRKLFEIMDPGDTGWHIKYRKEGGKWGHLIEYDVGTEENPAFTDKYRMIHWDEPAPTVVAHLAKDANNYIIPDYYEYANPDETRRDPARNRGVTPREAARLQSFPDDYVFLGPFTSQFRQIGNAVPPILAWHLGTTLQETVLRSPADPSVSSERGSPEAVSSDD
jgi:DNA (cytosine-5)-methyltransferase 1